MKKYIWGLTQEQWLILGIIFSMINFGIILKTVMGWKPSTVSELFRQDSILLNKNHFAREQYADSIVSAFLAFKKKNASAPTGRNKGDQTESPLSININVADQSSLIRLPGIGPALARRILKYRSEHGNFTSIQELTRVKGIGPKKLQSIREYIVVGENK